MSRINWLIATLLLFYALLLVVLVGCATPIKPDAGSVVVVPQVQRPPPPLIVQTTPPKPEGYFQKSFLNYFDSAALKPTKSMPPTHPATQPK